MEIQSIHIQTNRWFQKTYGNTYHRVKISIVTDDKNILILDSGRHYGYGNTWDQTALELFTEKLQIENPKDQHGRSKFWYLTQYAQHSKIPCIASVNDVSREKDL